MLENLRTRVVLALGNLPKEDYTYTRRTPEDKLSYNLIGTWKRKKAMIILKHLRDRGLNIRPRGRGSMNQRRNGHTKRNAARSMFVGVEYASQSDCPLETAEHWSLYFVPNTKNKLTFDHGFFDKLPNDLAIDLCGRIQTILHNKVDDETALDAVITAIENLIKVNTNELIPIGYPMRRTQEDVCSSILENLTIRVTVEYDYD